MNLIEKAKRWDIDVKYLHEPCEQLARGDLTAVQAKNVIDVRLETYRIEVDAAYQESKLSQDFDILFGDIDCYRDIFKLSVIKDLMELIPEFCNAAGNDAALAERLSDMTLEAYCKDENIVLTMKKSLLQLQYDLQEKAKELCEYFSFEIENDLAPKKAEKIGDGTTKITEKMQDLIDAGIVKNESPTNGKFSMQAKHGLDFVTKLDIAGFINHEKGSSDVVDALFVFDNIDTGCKLEILEKYYRDIKTDKKKPNKHQFGANSVPIRN